MENIQLSAESLVAVAIISTLVQQLKAIPFVESLKQYAPVYTLLSMALGIAYAYYAGDANFLVTGAIIGLTACGAYSVVKKKS